MVQSTKKYSIVGLPATKRRSEVVAIHSTDLPPITEETTLVSTARASEMLRDERGWHLSKVLIQRRCASGQWQQGIHWTKAGKQYLINMAAVYRSIVDGSA